MIDYELERNKYRPERIKTLLIGEAPPPSGKSYFYVPKEMSLGRSIEDDTSLPATIFNHYFGRRPNNISEYKKFLIELKNMGVFLIDIIDEPIKIRGDKENENYLISKLPELKLKIKALNEEMQYSPNLRPEVQLKSNDKLTKPTTKTTRRKPT
jgi:hypothetical protein